MIEEKARLRTGAAARRDRLHEEHGNAGTRLVRHFVSAFDIPRDIPVSGYWPMRSEIDPRPLLHELHERGSPCALPTIAQMNGPLLFRRWEPGDPLVAGRFGTREPAADAPQVVPALVLVPLLAFDHVGHRLGYGGGFYDRSLAALRADRAITAVGLAYAGQQIERVPVAPGDEKLDWIVTETGATRFPDSAPAQTMGTK